jgi:hypothetical protein
MDITMTHDTLRPGSQSAYVICPKCNHQNRPGTLNCQQCNTLLVGVSITTTRTLGVPPELAPAQPAGTTRVGSDRFETTMTLVLQIPGAARPITIKPSEVPEVMFGRLDATAQIYPQVDLTPYAAFQLGISRKHACIRLKEQQLFLHDFKSANGTYLNGLRVTEDTPQLLRNGDEIKLGQMTIQVRYEA